MVQVASYPAWEPYGANFEKWNENYKGDRKRTYSLPTSSTHAYHFTFAGKLVGRLLWGRVRYAGITTCTLHCTGLCA
eukprot:4377965-Pyramimonas_sp.AAC.1